MLDPLEWNFETSLPSQSSTPAHEITVDDTGKDEAGVGMIEEDSENKQKCDVLESKLKSCSVPRIPATCLASQLLAR